MKHRKLVLTASALGVLGAWAVAWGIEQDRAAEPPGHAGFFGHRHGGDPLDRLSQHLQLSEDQQTAIRAILEQARVEGDALRADLGSMRDDIQRMIREGSYTEDQARILVESSSPSFVEMTLLGIRTMSEVYAQLTPAQRTRADDMLERRPGRFGGPPSWFRPGL
jgi:Spy/CpxP family protein refolding chaperone